ncbi:beta-lactamase family protein [Corynebacterium sp. CNCTC7651]|uniref:serine hydrolase domain-containing protein n=1 Tax=Corynebacterium sp. CNCTC7651 TaxID=2815361 RepID=UPI001F2AE509|nr:serine hydrolase domain-containing protein [Corynebacterium sp. CNCTC7651]UIZ91652.1 beta-lactamase family protein [Corynebacterium sp. CNCTC7651]
MSGNILETQLAGWPADNVAAVIVGKREEAYGDAERVFALASVTKLLSAYGVLLAVEEGAFELDSACGPAGSTVRHLLAHASGVGFDSREQQKPAGERRIYSSAGYEILADFVEETTGIAFPEYLREGVFQPLGMETARLVGSAGHGAEASISDLAQFARELLSPKLLAEETLREARTNQFGDLRGVVPGYGMQKPCPWGLGFELKGEKSPHWTGDGMPAETAGHFGMSGTYLWVAGEHAMVALTDREFGDWAKPLWQETNTAIWAELG